MSKIADSVIPEIISEQSARKLEISTALTKAKSREPAYSQALNQNNIARQRVKIQRVRQADSQTVVVDGVSS